MLPFLVILALILGSCAQTQSTRCTCGGTELTLADQVHCFEIIPGTGGSWVSADAKCGARGGFLAHVNSSSLISQLKSYVDANYKSPLMVGETVGNVQTKLVALMCPNNQYSSVLSSSVISSLFTGNLTATNRCVFLQKSDYKLHYGACEATADVLCDFPMEKPDDVCDAQMNCTSTTTSTTTASTTPTTSLSSSTTISSTTTTSSTPSTKSTKPPIIPPVGSNSTSTSTTANATTPTTVSSTTTTLTPSTTTAASTTPSSTKSSSTLSSSTSLSTTRQPNTTYTSTTRNSSTTATSTQSTSAATNSTTTQTSTTSQTPNTTLSTTANSNVTTTAGNYTTTSTLSTANATQTPTKNATTTTAKNATTTTPKNAAATTKGGSAAPSNSTTKGPTGNSGTQRTTQAPAGTCPSGHTKAGKWCIPWWVWLLLGLLLLMLLLCLLAWLLHFCCRMCMGSHRPEKEIVERDREWSGVDAEQQTDVIFDPRSPRSATPAITVSPAPSTPTTNEIHHHHHHKTEVINNNNTVTSTPAPPASNVIYDVTVYENTFNFRKDAIPPLPIQPVPNSLMLLPPPEDQDSINSASMSIGFTESTPKHSPVNRLAHTAPVIPLSHQKTPAAKTGVHSPPSGLTGTGGSPNGGVPQRSNSHDPNEPPRGPRQNASPGSPESPESNRSDPGNRRPRQLPPPPPAKQERPFPPNKSRDRTPDTIDLPHGVSPPKSPFEVPSDDDTLPIGDVPPINGNNRPRNAADERPVFAANKPPGSNIPSNYPKSERKPSERPFPSPPSDPMSRDSPQRKAARRRTPPGNGGGSGGSGRSPNPGDPNMVPLRTFPAPPKQRSPSENGRRSPGQKTPEGSAPPRSRSSGPLMAPPGGGRSALGSPPDDGRGGSGRPDVNPRGARGKLGGVAGKSGAPEGWKPWGKNEGAFSSHPGFLDD